MSERTITVDGRVYTLSPLGYNADVLTIEFGRLTNLISTNADFPNDEFAAIVRLVLDERELAEGRGRELGRVQAMKGLREFIGADEAREEAADKADRVLALEGELAHLAAEVAEIKSEEAAEKDERVLALEGQLAHLAAEVAEIKSRTTASGGDLPLSWGRQ